jgi:hypothetical protein
MLLRGPEMMLTKKETIGFRDMKGMGEISKVNFNESVNTNV